VGQIVCVHGIGQQRAGEQTVLRVWTLLLEGVTRACHSDAATGADVVMDFCGDLFRYAQSRFFGGISVWALVFDLISVSRLRWASTSQQTTESVHPPRKHFQGSSRWRQPYRPRRTEPGSNQNPCGKVKMTRNDRPLRYHSEHELFEIIRDREEHRRYEEKRWAEFEEANSVAFGRGEEWVWESPEYKGYKEIVQNMDRDIKTARDELAARREDRKQGGGGFNSN
jgi:hypothetical protein